MENKVSFCKATGATIVSEKENSFVIQHNGNEMVITKDFFNLLGKHLKPVAEKKLWKKLKKK